MRDVLLLLVLIILLYFTFKNPVIGVALSVWSSLFTPGLWTYGFGQSLRVNLIITLCTLFSIIINGSKTTKIHESSKIFALVIIFFIHGTISTIFNTPQTDIAWIEWDYFYKTLFLTLLIKITVTDKKSIELILWSIVLSICFIGAYEGLKAIVTFGSHILTGISGSKYRDRNAISLALNISLPIIIFLYTKEKGKISKILLAFTMLLVVSAILGSFSRGGLIGLIVLTLYYIITFKNKVRNISLVTLITIVFLNFLPDKWFDRMNTIKSADEDASFLGRAAAWKEAILIGNDNPVFGGGFKSGQDVIVWKYYESEFHRFDYIIDTSQIKFAFPKAAHSIYFQVIADLGYVGLFIYLTLIFLTYKQLHKQTLNTKYLSDWERELAAKLKISIIVFLVSGAALSLPYNDIIFIIIGLTLSIQKISDKNERNQ